VKAVLELPRLLTVFYESVNNFTNSLSQDMFDTVKSNSNGKQLNNESKYLLLLLLIK